MVLSFINQFQILISDNEPLSFGYALHYSYNPLKTYDTLTYWHILHNIAGANGNIYRQINEWLVF